MILARDIINAKLHSENLPSVSYRISADYGKVEVATSKRSGSHFAMLWINQTERSF
jgi:hypothetical protein